MSVFQKDKTGHWLNSYLSLKVRTFFGHPVERMDPSNFQIFEIQVSVFNYWWFAYDVIKNMIMQIMIDLSQILIWPIRP